MMSHFAVYEVVSYLFYRFYIVSSAFTRHKKQKVLKSAIKQFLQNIDKQT